MQQVGKKTFQQRPWIARQGTDQGHGQVATGVRWDGKHWSNRTANNICARLTSSTMCAEQKLLHTGRASEAMLVAAQGRASAFCLQRRRRSPPRYGESTVGDTHDTEGTPTTLRQSKRLVSAVCAPVRIGATCKLTKQPPPCTPS